MNHRAINKRQILKQLPLFAALSESELTLVAQRCRLVDVGKDEVIYAEGDPPDALYVMVTGRARIVTGSAGAREEVLEVVHHGDYFGVISLLTQQPHSVTVRALNDSILIKIRQPEFEALLREIPSLAVHVSQTLSRRLAQKRQGHAKKVFESTIVSIYSAVAGTGRTQYAINLACALHRETAKRVILVGLNPSGAEISHLLHAATPPAISLRGAGFDPARVHQAIVTSPHGIAILDVAYDPSHLSNVTQIAPLLAFLAHEFPFVAVDFPRALDRTVFKGLGQSDVIHLVSDAQPESLVATCDLVGELARTIPRAPERVKVIVVEGRDGVPAEGQAAVLRCPVHATLPHVVSPPVDRGLPIVLQDPAAGYSQAVRRIAREVGGVLVGLALGSGAALGLAHIGVLRVLEQERIPVDVVAGSSIGALIGAFWASGIDAYGLERVAMRFRGKWRTFRLFAGDLAVFPTFGFLTGAGVVRLLRQHLGDRTFRDLRIPLKIVACDYAARRVAVFDEGSVVEAIRASISIPAIFIPHSVGGRWLIDGGILDPVPVNVLLQAGVHKIIAVNALPSPEDIQRRHDELAAEAAARAQQAAGGWTKRWRRWRHRMFEAIEPRIADVIMHSMQAMEYVLAEHGCQQADVVLHPTLPRVNWYEFYSVTELIRRGEEEARRFLPQITQLVQL